MSSSFNREEIVLVLGVRDGVGVKVGVEVGVVDGAGENLKKISLFQLLGLLCRNRQTNIQLTRT